MIYTEQHRELMRSVPKFVQSEVDPHGDEWEKEGIFPAHELFKKFGSQGFLGINKPEKFGGLGLDYSYSVAFCEALGTMKAKSVAMAVGVQTDMATPALTLHGSDELREEFLRPSISGNYVACLGVSEVGAGSDVASIKTTARKDGSDYVIDGGKMWTTNGTQADWMCLLANTSDGPVHRNKSLDLPADEDQGRGDRAASSTSSACASSDTRRSTSTTCACRSATASAKRAWASPTRCSNSRKSASGAPPARLGGMERGIRLTIEYTRERHAFGKSILDNQVVHFKLAELETEVEAAARAVYRAVEEYVGGADVTAARLDGQAQGGPARARGLRLVPAVLGRHGLHWREPVSRIYRDARLSRSAAAPTRSCSASSPRAWVSSRVSAGIDVAGFAKVLIANRGEIALRVMRTARALGYRDRGGLFRRRPRHARTCALADRAVRDRAGAGRRVVLCASRGSSKRRNARAPTRSIRAMASCRRTPTSPTPAPPPASSSSARRGMRSALMGNKAAAKRRMAEAGVPCVPGYEGEDQSERGSAARGRAHRLSGDGQGCGRRRRQRHARSSRTARELADALRSARARRRSGAFGDEELILERAIAAPRHVEIQVFADAHGNVIHLGERDCSVQRRHQKVIEEAPSPAVDAALRGAWAKPRSRRPGDRLRRRRHRRVPAGRATAHFYFLEMNTRLQVEHPVTEAITGLDLVEWQLRVAAGEPLPLRAGRCCALQSGHAIEARLYAEDPARRLPAAAGHACWLASRPRACASITGWRRASRSRRSTIDARQAHRPRRRRATRRARRLAAALRRHRRRSGVATNRDFLARVPAHPAFAAGDVDTGVHRRRLCGRRRVAPDARLLALAAALIAELTRYDANETLSYLVEHRRRRRRRC